MIVGRCEWRSDSDNKLHLNTVDFTDRTGRLAVNKTHTKILDGFFALSRDGFVDGSGVRVDLRAARRIMSAGYSNVFGWPRRWIREHKINNHYGIKSVLMPLVVH